MSYLEFEGEKMPDPVENGVTITKEKIWTNGTGRTKTGKMVGSIKYIVNKVQIKWPELTGQQIAKMDNYISNKSKPFVKMKYVNECGTSGNITVYFGTPTYPIYRYENGVQKLAGVAVDAIEQ